MIAAQALVVGNLPVTRDCLRQQEMCWREYATRFWHGGGILNIGREPDGASDLVYLGFAVIAY